MRTELLTRHPVPLKLEEKGAGVWFKLRFAIRREHEIIEELRIKKPRMRVSGLHAIPSLLRVGRNSDLLSHLEAYLEVSRNLIHIVPKLLDGCSR